MDQQLLHYIFKQRIRVINLKKKKKVCQEIQHPKLQLLIPPLCSEKSQLFLTADVTKLMDLLWMYIGYKHSGFDPLDRWTFVPMQKNPVTFK